VAGKKPNSALVGLLGEAPFSKLADDLPALCFVADPQGRVVWCNRRWHDYTGVPRDADLDRAWRTVHHEAMLADVAQRWARAIEKGLPGEAVIQLRGGDGRCRPFLTRAEPLRGTADVLCWLGTMVEISSVEQVARDQAFLVRLDDRLRDEIDPASIVAAVGEALGRYLGVAAIGYADVVDGERAADEEHLRWSRGADGCDFEPARLGRSAWAGLRKGKTWMVRAGAASETSRGGPAEQVSAFYVPVLAKGTLCAIFYVESRVPRIWRDNEIKLVEEVAARTSATLARAAAELARRESEERLRLALEGAMLGTIEWDLKARRGRWSERACAIYGVQYGAEVTVEQFRALVHPDDRERVFSVIREALDNGDHYSVDYRVLHPDGTQRWVVSRAKVQRDPACRPIGTIGVVIDVTARKLAEERLRESEARQRAIVDTSPECVKIVGADGTLCYINRAGLRMIDATDEEGVLGLDVASVVAPEHRAAWIENHRRVCAGEAVTWEFDVIGLEGTRRRVETHAVPLPTDGSLQHLAVTRDVTERRNAEERLRESEALLAAFMKNAPIGMYLKDADGRYLMLNPEMAKVFGRPVEQVVGRTAAELFGPDEAAMIAAHDRKILETEQARRVEEYLPGLEAYGWSLVVRFPVSLAGERPTRIGGFDIDISERKRTEVELARSRETLYQAEKLTALGSLLAGVSHELNNPLSVILAQAQLLESKAEGTRFAERAATIRSAAGRCAKIVQSFLAMARQKAPARSRLDLNDVIRSALELAGYALRTAGIRVIEELDANLPPIDADGDQLNQVVLNLIVNAQHALEEKDGARILTVKTVEDRQRRLIRLTVADNGPGVPEPDRARLFAPFFSTKARGSGLGLALCQRIVVQHGGTIVHETPDAGGARFRITLPVSESHERGDD